MRWTALTLCVLVAGCGWRMGGEADPAEVERSARSAAGAVAPAGSPFAGVSLTITGSTLDPPGLQQPCRGRFVLLNMGAGYALPDGYRDTSGYDLSLFDSRGTRLFQSAGSIGRGLKSGEEKTVEWSTAGDDARPAFVLPKAGTYVLKIVVYRARGAGLEEILCSSCLPFTVK